MQDDLRKELLKAALEIERAGLIALSGGNLSARLAENTVLVTPSGMSYRDLGPEDLVLVDMDGNVLQGHRRPSVDTPALLHLYQNLAEVNAIIHTHQPYATAVGLVEDSLPAVLTTLANATDGDVPVAPYASASSVDMGAVAVDILKRRKAAILRNHGVLAVGKTIKQALYAAVYLEEAAKTYIAARTLGKPLELTQEQVGDAIAVFSTYGQPASGDTKGGNR